jgi:CheY-like chemotaxis protein
MINESISAILDYLYSEATLATGTLGADRLLRSIGDVRDLLSGAAAQPGAMEEFEMVTCAGDIIDILNLASGKRVQRAVLKRPPGALPVTQDRRAVEQMLTRVLGCALKLAEAGEALLSVSIAASESGIELALTMSETDLAVRVAKWLNADLDRVQFQNPEDVSLGIALMVAGKRLRVLGGAASLGAPSTVTLGLPSQPRVAGCGDCTRTARPGALNILVAEDDDESFVLTEMALEDAHVWRARDGQDALELVRKRRFDAIFMDIHMPGMNGYEVIQSMRDWETRTGHPRTPMIILSSDDLETQQRSAAEFGCSGFLRKPLQKWDLMPLLQRLK